VAKPERGIPNNSEMEDWFIGVMMTFDGIEPTSPYNALTFIENERHKSAKNDEFHKVDVCTSIIYAHWFGSTR